MADEDYEIIPHQLLSDLKFDVEALKKKLTQPDAKINELLLELESVKDSVHDLHTIFQKALEEVQGGELLAVENLEGRAPFVGPSKAAVLAPAIIRRLDLSGLEIGSDGERALGIPAAPAHRQGS